MNSSCLFIIKLYFYCQNLSIMLENIVLSRVLFLDIETVPAYPSYNQLDERFKKLWDKKAMNLQKAESNSESEVSFDASISSVEETFSFNS